MVAAHVKCGPSARNFFFANPCAGVRSFQPEWTGLFRPHYMSLVRAAEDRVQRQPEYLRNVISGSSPETGLRIYKELTPRKRISLIWITGPCGFRIRKRPAWSRRGSADRNRGGCFSASACALRAWPLPVPERCNWRRLSEDVQNRLRMRHCAGQQSHIFAFTISALRTRPGSVPGALPTSG